MKHGKAPDPNMIHPIAGYDKEIYVKPTIQNPNITVGDFCFRLFRETLHMTPIEYIRSYRLQKACQMLANTKDTITQIAYNCGLGSSSHFGKTFREVYHCTPLEYRRNWHDCYKNGR